MCTKFLKTRKVTVKDVLDENELVLLGLTELIDGTPLNPLRKVFQFLHDSGMRETSEYIEIQARYRDKMRDKEERKKYFHEISCFIGRYYR